MDIKSSNLQTAQIEDFHSIARSIDRAILDVYSNGFMTGPAELVQTLDSNFKRKKMQNAVSTLRIDLHVQSHIKDLTLPCRKLGLDSVKFVIKVA